MVTTVAAWLLIGSTAGWLASLAVRGTASGRVGDMVVGVVGALLGGFLSATLLGGSGVTGPPVTSLFVASVGACTLLLLWRPVAMRVVATGKRQMHNKEAPAAERDAGRSLTGVLRTDLLLWRFSGDEIDRLSKLQLRYRAQPDRLDLPLDECRLRFARWLVEHGRMGEDDDTAFKGPPWEEEMSGASGESWRQGSQPPSPRGTPPGHPDGEAAPASACLEGRANTHLRPLGVWSWLRHSGTGAAGSGRGPGSLRRLLGEGGPWAWDPHDPYGNARSYEDAQWLWMRFRHDC